MFESSFICAQFDSKYKMNEQHCFHYLRPCWFISFEKFITNFSPSFRRDESFRFIWLKWFMLPGINFWNGCKSEPLQNSLSSCILSLTESDTFLISLERVFILDSIQLKYLTNWFAFWSQFHESKLCQ